jgi:twitching motility protein PilT
MELGSKDDMNTLNQALAVLVRKNEITMEEALVKSSHPEHLQKVVGA